ncbi:MAG: nucleotidyl transferase AbiEii/AbiGii toxin family protein [Anaerolineae bacterium]|nr:nucleotidyl transferase AbiEii/AbiGii toxin family protein [Anaerolineae bacterium]
MPTIDQQLRSIARSRQGVPYWILEKDYALGYLLSGMAQVRALREALVLKGETALRKFYFAEYRFSEDLDFSALVPPSDIDTAMHEAVVATEAQLGEEGPFSVTMERLTLRDPHPGGQDAFTVMVRFPTHREPLCRLKVEITYDEPVLLPPVTRTLLHPYPDPPQAPWSCYPLEEIVAEKLRALLQSDARLRERGWGATRVCRDAYDLWYVLGHHSVDATLFPGLLDRKCAVRQVTYAGVADFLTPALQAVARAEWARLLRPFVPGAPSADQVLNELTDMLIAIHLDPEQIEGDANSHD